jgi:hypothetical protein
MIPNRKVMTAALVVEMTIGLLVIAGTIQAATSINTCPFVISSPGVYLLSANLIYGGGNGITITSSNVTLALEDNCWRERQYRYFRARVVVHDAAGGRSHIGSRSDHKRRRKCFQRGSCRPVREQLRSEPLRCCGRASA